MNARMAPCTQHCGVGNDTFFRFVRDKVFFQVERQILEKRADAPFGLAAPVVVTGAASAQQSFRTAGQDLEWADSFDIATDNITEVKSYAPTLSPDDG
jgi:hypothetical protein